MPSTLRRLSKNSWCPSSTFSALIALSDGTDGAFIPRGNTHPYAPGSTTSAGAAFTSAFTSAFASTCFGATLAGSPQANGINGVNDTTRSDTRTRRDDMAATLHEVRTARQAHSAGGPSARRRSGIADPRRSQFDAGYSAAASMQCNA